MAHYEKSDTYRAASEDDIQSMMIQKAHDLFNICDIEQKGFINKRDMQRLQTELHLTPTQLESVFDSLDDDQNGFLTLEEFTEGFGSFLGLPSSSEPQRQLSTSSNSSRTKACCRESVYENGSDDDCADDEEHFSNTMESLGIHSVFDDVDQIKLLWSRLRKDEPELLGKFEDFLARVSGEVKRTQQDFLTLESALKNKSTAHDEEVRKLYEEMENQIRLEKERALAEERAKERQLREDLETELYEKDRQLLELLAKHTDMENELEFLNSQECQTKQENEMLQKEKEEMRERLEQSRVLLDDSQSQIDSLKGRQKDEKRERAMAAIHISEGIAMERESLVKQLEMLRDMNQKLRDERDESESKRVSEK